MSFTKNDQAVVLNRESLQYLANCIRLVHSLPDLLNDVLPSQTTTYSSYKVTELLNTLNTDLQNYVNNALGNLSHLKKAIVPVAPTDNSADEDTIYLVQDASGGYEQYLKINGVVTSLGSTSAINNVYTKTESEGKFALISTLNSLITTVGGLNDLTTTDKTSIVNAINELKTDLTTHTNDTNIHITSAERTLWNTVSNIASGIGGRNLLIGTSVEKRKDINTPTDFTTFDTYTTFNKSTLSDLGYSVGDELTLSFEWEISQNGSLSEVYGDFSLEWIGVNNNGFDGEYLGPIKKSVDTFSSSHKKGKVSLTTKITSNNILGANAVRIRIDNSVVNFKVSKMKLEKGTIATDWTPAPEDEDMPTRRIAFVGSDAKDSNGWYKVAEQTCSGYGDTNITFMVTSTFKNYNVGILQLQIRSDNSSISCKTLKWLTRIGFNVNNYVVVIDGMKWTLYAYQPCPRYGRIAFEILSMSSIDNKDMTWALNFADNSTKETTEPVATVTSSDGASVADVETWTYAQLTYTDTTKTDTPGGSVSYRIKNGICFVRCTVGENITGKNVIEVSGMPPIDGSVNVLLDNDGACVGSVWGYNGTELLIHKTNSKVGYASFSYIVLES